MNKMSNLDDNMCELKEAELEAVMGGGKNECSIVFASHPDTPVEVFVAAFIKAGGTMVYSQRPASQPTKSRHPHGGFSCAPRLAASFNRHRAGAPSPTTALPQGN
jgi:hypothetical protein